MCVSKSKLVNQSHSSHDFSFHLFFSPIPTLISLFPLHFSLPSFLYFPPLHLSLPSFISFFFPDSSLFSLSFIFSLYPIHHPSSFSLSLIYVLNVTTIQPLYKVIGLTRWITTKVSYTSNLTLTICSVLCHVQRIFAPSFSEWKKSL